MSLMVISEEVAAAQRTIRILPDPSFVSFVAKAQKAKTRKGKEYFVLRVTIPREAAKEMEVGPDDYLVFRAKRAQWYHMINWSEMSTTWRMLPAEVKREVTITGLPNPDFSVATTASTGQPIEWLSFAATAASVTGESIISLAIEGGTTRR